MELLSESLVSALELQMAHEKRNAHTYLFVSGFLKSKGLDKIASIFDKQYKEEESHFLKINKFLTDLNIVPEILEINTIDMNSSGIQDNIISIGRKYLELEKLTSESLGDILELSESEGNHVACEFIREMLKDQVHEYEESTDFLDKSELCGSNWMNVLIWNNGLE